MGPRKKLQGILKEEQAKKVFVLLHTTSIFLINTVPTFDAFSKFLCNNACILPNPDQEKRKHDKERRAKEAEEKRIRDQVAAEMQEAKAAQGR